VQKKNRNSEYRRSEFQFSDSPNIGISKKKPTGSFRIENGTGIPLTMGVLEIGTKNWNSQPRPMALEWNATKMMF
jgi:hypothetical protein